MKKPNDFKAMLLLLLCCVIASSSSTMTKKMRIPVRLSFNKQRGGGVHKNSLSSCVHTFMSPEHMLFNRCTDVDT